MQITFVLPDLSVGGLQWHLVRLANFLADQPGIQVRILLMSSDLTLAEMLRAGISVFAMNGKFSSLRSLLRLLKHLRSDRSNVIVAWSLYPSIYIGMLAPLFRRAKLIAFEANYPPHAYGFGKGRGLSERLYKMFMPNFSVITANSNGTVEYLEELFPHSSVKRCYNPVPAPKVAERSAEISWPSAGYKFLTVGRLVNRHKGFDMLLEAARLLQQSCSLEWSICIIGSGPDRQALEDQIERCALQARVRLIGQRHDVADWMNACDTFLLTSRFEGFPNVLIEALKMAKLSIATDCETGPREVIKNGETGYLIEVDNPDEYAAAMLRAMQLDKKTRYKLATNGYEAAKRFDVDAAGQQFLSEIIR